MFKVIQRNSMIEWFQIAWHSFTNFDSNYTKVVVLLFLNWIHNALDANEENNRRSLFWFIVSKKNVSFLPNQRNKYWFRRHHAATNLQAALKVPRLPLTKTIYRTSEDDKSCIQIYFLYLCSKQQVTKSPINKL